MSEPKKSICKKCSREIKWGKKTLDNGKTIPIPLELDGSEHTEKVGDIWQCKKSGSGVSSQNTQVTNLTGAPQTTADKGQEKLDTTSPDFIQAMGKIIINLEERKRIEEKILLVLEQIRDKLK